MTLREFLEWWAAHHSDSDDAGAAGEPSVAEPAATTIQAAGDGKEGATTTAAAVTTATTYSVDSGCFHGKGGSSADAAHSLLYLKDWNFQRLFPDYDLYGPVLGIRPPRN